MPSVHHVLRPAATVALVIGCLVGAAACSSSSKSSSAKTATSTTSTTSKASTSASSTSSSVATAATHVPASCSAIPTSLIGTYIGGVAHTMALAAAPGAVSCEFANASASTIAVVNIGKGNAAAFATLQSASGQGGRTVTPISGLGTSAFSISKGGVPAGVAVLTADGTLYSVTANLPTAQTEAMISQLMKLP